MTARFFSIAIIGFILLASPAWAGKDEIDFVTRASVGNLFAIAESQLAVERASDPAVNALAQQLVDDHKKAEAELESATDGSGATAATALDADHQTRATALQGKSGADFDKAYAADQGENHSNLLTLYADYMLLGDNAKLKPLAIKMIPITEQQLKKVQGLSGN
jgi:putative membrane protein